MNKNVKYLLVPRKFAGDLEAIHDLARLALKDRDDEADDEEINPDIHYIAWPFPSITALEKERSHLVALYTDRLKDATGEEQKRLAAEALEGIKQAAIIEITIMARVIE